MTTAKLPTEHRMDAPRPVSELKSGETGQKAFTDFLVRENGDCFLRAAAKPRNKSVNTIVVRRDDAGYHVIIPANIKYSPGKNLVVEERLPVASIAIGQEE